MRQIAQSDEHASSGDGACGQASEWLATFFSLRPSVLRRFSPPLAHAGTFRGPLLLGGSRSRFSRIALDVPRLWDEALISNQCNHKETRDRQARENVPSLVAQPTHARANFTSVREKSCPLNRSGSFGLRQRAGEAVSKIQLGGWPLVFPKSR